MSGHRRSGLAGYVLAGGRSRRMGTEKALVVYDGIPMGLRVANAMQRFCGEVAVVGKNPGLAGLGLRWVPDAMPEFHPLVGIVSAMRDAAGPWVLVAPCDLPHLHPEHLAELLACEGPAVAMGDDGLHPLLAILPVDWADRAATLVLAGAPVRRLVDPAHRVWLPPSALQNVNQAADLPVEGGRIALLKAEHVTAD